MSGCAILHNNPINEAINPIELLTPKCPEFIKTQGPKLFDSTGSLVLLLTVSYVPYKSIKEYIGFVDIHILREIPRNVEAEKCSMRLMKIIEQAHQTIKSKVRALGGNALIGYKIINLAIERDVNNLSKVNISISGTAVMYE